MNVRAPRELLPHEAALVETGALQNVSHDKASSWWYEAPALGEASEGRCLVYRHMGDVELDVLLRTNQLPDTQPYQTIVEGALGLKYCKKYFTGAKYVDTGVTTIVEFEAPRVLVDELFAKFSKPEDGCMSHGLGSKAGKTLPQFNAALAGGETSWRVVFVKRRKRQKR